MLARDWYYNQRRQLGLDTAVASIYGWLAFGEVLSGLDIAGMVLVGAALAVSRGRA